MAEFAARHCARAQVDPQREDDRDLARKGEGRALGHGQGKDGTLADAF